MCKFCYDFRKIERKIKNNNGLIIDWDYKILFILIDSNTGINFKDLNEQFINKYNIDSSIYIFMIHKQDGSMYCYNRNDIVAFVKDRWASWFIDKLNWEDFPNLQNEPKLIYPRL